MANTASGVEDAATESKEKSFIRALSLPREVNEQHPQSQHSRPLFMETGSNASLLSISKLHLAGDSHSATSVPNGDVRHVPSELGADRSASQLLQSLDMTYYPSNSLFTIQYFIKPE